jgi:chemotaxis protein MotB
MTRDRKIWSAVVVGALTTSTMACGYNEAQMQTKRDRIDQLTGALEDQERKNQELNERFKVVASENASVREQLRDMGMSIEDSKRTNEELNALVADLRAKEKRAEKRLQTFKRMKAKFLKMIDSGQLRVRIVRGRMVVELAESILFDSGKANLKEEGQTALAEVAGVLQSIDTRDFQIAGHTDNVPIRTHRFRSNWHLSTSRAVTVAGFLAQNGVPDTRLSAAGYAETQPVADNETDEGRAQNRRIEIVLMPNLDELPDLSSLEAE